MTDLKKLSKNFNLKTLSKSEAINLKGGRRMRRAKLNYSMAQPTKPGFGGGGAGLPPDLKDSVAFGS